MKKLSNKHKYKSNPRIITKKQFELLKDHIIELGDLSGVVYCINNKAFVGGNQRSEIFNNCLIEVLQEFDPPTNTGTTLLGNIIYNGEKYSYREVSFTKEQFEKACIVANNDGGFWDWDMLANEFDHEKLNEWGLETPDNWDDDIPEDDLSQNDIENQQEKVNFAIVCQNIDELDKLQTKLNTDKIRMGYQEFLTKAGL